MSNNNKKILAEQLKNELNKPEYVAVPNLISSGGYYGRFIAFDFLDENSTILDQKKNGHEKFNKSQLEPDD